ncbi:MAG: glycosyltransferase [Candidatus Ryanbacteria bacterium]|nr:glycosyltransferase [Candidatus Ryanbacteria bacterium]
MNILFITPSPPSRFHRIRALNLIKYLSKNHQIYLISLTFKKRVTPDEFASYCQEIAFVYQSRVRAYLTCALFLFTPIPLEVAYCRNPYMRKKIADFLEEHPIDLVYIKRLRSIQFIGRDLNVPIVIDTTDAMSLFYSRAARHAPWGKKVLFYEEAWKYRCYEKKLLRRFRWWVVSSPVDGTYLRSLAPPETTVAVVPNGVDTAFYKPTTRAPEQYTIFFSGLMDKFVNSEAAQYFLAEIFPKVLEKIPAAKVYIVGPHPPHNIKKFASSQIVITGEVPDIREYIERSTAVVVPLKTGAGTRNKILQAWAIGRPVVVTSKGLEGLEGENGKHVLIADNPKDFASMVIKLFLDRALQKRLIENSYQLVKEKYSMENIVDELNKFLPHVVS